MRRTFGDPPKSGGDWIRGNCQRATFVTDACAVSDPQCPTCQVAAEYDLLELIGSGTDSTQRSTLLNGQERSAQNTLTNRDHSFSSDPRETVQLKAEVETPASSTEQETKNVLRAPTTEPPTDADLRGDLRGSLSLAPCELCGRVPCMCGKCPATKDYCRRDCAVFDCELQAKPAPPEAK